MANYRTRPSLCQRSRRLPSYYGNVLERLDTIPIQLATSAWRARRQLADKAAAPMLAKWFEPSESGKHGTHKGDTVTCYLHLSHLDGHRTCYVLSGLDDLLKMQ